jgi:hypothetical protein
VEKLKAKVYKMNLHILEEITSPARFQQFLGNCCSGKKLSTQYLVLLNSLTLWTSPPLNALKVIKLLDYCALGAGSAPVFSLVSKTQCYYRIIYFVYQHKLRDKVGNIFVPKQFKNSDLH